MARPQKDGHPLRLHLAQAARMGSKVARARLEAPPIPDACADVWTAFVELHAARTWDDAKPQAISYCEMQAWATLTRQVLRSWEVEWLKLLDTAWLAGEMPDGPAAQRQA